jgi:hypothetical protein
MSRVTGLRDTLNNLNAEIARIEGRSMAGLVAAGAYIKRESVKLAPVDTGNLRGSSFMNTQPSSVEIGFGALYASFVHENVEMKLKGLARTSGSGKGRYWDSGEPKFLEKVINRQEEILQIIVRRARRE